MFYICNFIFYIVIKTGVLNVQRCKDWFRLESTKELINDLSADGRILPSGLVETKRGGNDKSKQGSWIHPDLSIQLDFSQICHSSKWIRSLFSVGSVEIDLTLLRDKDRDKTIVLNN